MTPSRRLEAVTRGALLALFTALMLDETGSLGWAILGIPVTLSKVAMLGLIAIWGVGWRGSLGALPGSVRGALGGFLLALLLSTSLSTQPWSGLSALATSAMQVALLGIVASTSAHVALRRLLPALATVSAFALVHGVIDGAIAVSRAHDAVDAVYMRRTSGFFSDPVDWMGALLLTVPAWIVALRDREEVRHDGLRGLLLGGLVLAALASRSRTAILIVIPLGIGLSWWLRARPRGLALALALTVPGAWWLLDLEGFGLRFGALLTPERELAVGHGSIAMRKALWGAAWQLWWDNPWFGVGPGAFPELSLGAHPSEIPHWPHNTPLGLLAETGVIGLASFGAVLWTVARAMGHAWTRAPASRRGALSGIGVALLATAALSLVVDLWARPMGWFMLGIGLGVARQKGGVGAAEVDDELGGDQSNHPASHHESRSRYSQILP